MVVKCGKMSYFINICSICLKQSSNLVFIRTKDTNGTSFEDKLKYFIPALEFKSTFPKYICAECRRNLRKVYEFKQICLRNMTTYENYAQQVATINGCHKYLSVTIRPDFVYKEEISDGNNYDASVLELKSEIDVNIIESEELIIKEETNEDLILNGNLKSSPRYIEEENIQSGDTCPDFVHIKAGISDENNYDTNIAESQTEIDIGVVNREEFFIKEEKNEKLVLEDKLEPLLYDTKQDNPKSNFTCKQTENIVEGTAQISDVSITQLTENKNICEQREFTYNEKLFECETCNNSFEYSRDLERHQLTHTKKLFTCKICGKSVKNLKKHNLTHGKERPHKCEICNKSFRVSNTLQRHYLIHTDEKPFTCEVCNKSFRRSSALKIHKLIHTGEKPFTCENCNKSFRESSTLKKHKLVHTGRKPREKPFTCEVCNKSFGKTNTLNRHRVTHTGEKPYTCEICKKSFPRLFTLKNHQLLHTSEKPYTCEICDKKFRQLANLKRHKIVHTSEKPYTCEICNTPYRWLSNLSKHKLVHTGEKPYTCEVCNKSFTAKRSLQKHSRIHSN